jgi:hypothetical protein
MTRMAYAWGWVLLAAACTESGPVGGIRRVDQGSGVVVDASIVVDAALLEPTMDDGVPLPLPDAGVRVDARVAEDGGTPDRPAPEPPACGELGCPRLGDMAQVCVEVPSSDGGRAFGCVPDPRGLAYLGHDFRLGGAVADYPEAAVVEEMLSDVLNNSGYGLALVFPGARDREPFNPLDFPAHLVQGARRVEDGTYVGAERVSTSTRSRVVLDLPDFPVPDVVPDALALWVVFPHADPAVPEEMDPTLSPPGGAIDIIVPFISQGVPCFSTLGSARSVVVALLPPSGARSPTLVARMNLCLGVRAADVFIGDRTLGDVLGEISDPVCDSDGDDLPDGWPIDVVATMRAIEFTSDPAVFEDAPVEPACD